MSRGILSGGFCPGGFVRGDFVLIPLKLMSLENVYANPHTYRVDQLNTLCKNKMRSIFTEFWNSEFNMADIGSVRNS